MEKSGWKDLTFPHLGEPFGVSDVAGAGPAEPLSQALGSQATMMLPWGQAPSSAHLRQVSVAEAAPLLLEGRDTNRVLILWAQTSGVSVERKMPQSTAWGGR